MTAKDPCSRSLIVETYSFIDVVVVIVVFSTILILQFISERVLSFNVLAVKLLLYWLESCSLVKSMIWCMHKLMFVVLT